MNPLIGAALISGGLQGIGGLLNSGAKMSKQQLAEMKREFDISQQFSQEQGRTQTQMAQTSDLNNMQRQIEMSPLRDKVGYMLNQRMGMVPQQFRPNDMLNPGSTGAGNLPQQGGINSEALQGAMQHYQAPDFMTNKIGSGGIDPALYHQMMARLGLSGPYGHQQIGDVPIQHSTFGGQAPPQAPHAPTNPNGSMQNPTAPNGIRVNPGYPPPPTWGGGGMPGSQGIVPPQPTGPPGDFMPPGPRPLRPQANLMRRY